MYQVRSAWVRGVCAQMQEAPGSDHTAVREEPCSCDMIRGLEQPQVWQRSNNKEQQQVGQACFYCIGLLLLQVPGCCWSCGRVRYVSHMHQVLGLEAALVHSSLGHVAQLMH